MEIKLKEPKLLECLADIEHQRWSKWQKHLHDVCKINGDGSLIIPKAKVIRFQREIDTNYKDLPNYLKDYDRIEARKIIKGISKYLKEAKKQK